MWTHIDNTQQIDLTIYERQVWIFGLIEEETEKVKLFKIDDRTTGTF